MGSTRNVSLPPLRTRPPRPQLMYKIDHNLVYHSDALPVCSWQALLTGEGVNYHGSSMRQSAGCTQGCKAKLESSWACRHEMVCKITECCSIEFSCMARPPLHNWATCANAWLKGGELTAKHCYSMGANVGCHYLWLLLSGLSILVYPTLLPRPTFTIIFTGIFTGWHFHLCLARSLQIWSP